jgi:hypothetical protein
MDRDFRFTRPAALAAVTLPQSAPGGWTALAELLFQPGQSVAPAAPQPLLQPANDRHAPRPANDRHPSAKRRLDGVYRLVGR